ncbi:MAG: class I SAM-dependent methyltransferase [archaeon]|nr:class I SAM-dependent methyltransferase [archaeon]
MNIFQSHKSKFLSKILKPGLNVLDYGCGPGGYSIPTAIIVGKSGKVFAADIRSFRIQKVEKAAKKKKLNIETILIEKEKNDTGLEDCCIDVIFCFNMLHFVKDSNSNDLISEFHRVLKENSILYVYCQYLKEKELLSKVTSLNLFKLAEKVGKIHYFLKVEKNPK